MQRSLYLVNPRADWPSYYGAEVVGDSSRRKPAALVADLTVATVAAMAPEGFKIKIVDESIHAVNFDDDCDFVGITGKINQWQRMRAIAEEFRKRRKLVLIGGPYASLSPAIVRPHCDILVKGEIEAIASKLFADLSEGTWQEEYDGGRPDLSSSPVPRWDIYPNERALLACVQTSRGCPFECEFCDVIQYLGRKQRHKSIDQVLKELDEVYSRGYRSVFLADDNFTVYRSRAKELLAALKTWNTRLENGKVEFVTQVSIDAARDPELLRMCAEAGLVRCFIGIETPNAESLREAKKRQNLRIDLASEVRCFFEQGIQVMAGMIVGFDHDSTEIFDKHYEFAMSSGIPILALGALAAPEATPLYQRLKQEGRLIEAEHTPLTWETNLVPKLMTREQLSAGIQRLCNRLYHPRAFGERVIRFIELLGPRRDPASAEDQAGRQVARDIEFEVLDLIAGIPRLGPEEALMWSRIAKALRRKPQATRPVFAALMQYRQIRYMYEHCGIWQTQAPTGYEEVSGRDLAIQGL